MMGAEARGFDYDDGACLEVKGRSKSVRIYDLPLWEIQVGPSSLREYTFLVGRVMKATALSKLDSIKFILRKFILLIFCHFQ